MRPKLSYANVMATIAVFIALGGASYAASHLGKKTVGAKQLKPNAVTSAKLKKNAVTAAKIKNNAVTGAKIMASSINSSKIADGSVTGTDINAPSMPFSQIVQKARGSGAVTLKESGNTVFPLSPNPFSYTQEAGSDDTYVGAIDVTFEPSCKPPRSVDAHILVDPLNPTTPTQGELAGLGESVDLAGGEVSTRTNIAPDIGGVRFERDTPTNHALYLVARIECGVGTVGTEDAMATFGAIDVIGTK